MRHATAFSLAPAPSVVQILHLAKRVPPCAIAETRYVPSGLDGCSDAMSHDAQSVTRLVAHLGNEVVTGAVPCPQLALSSGPRLQRWATTVTERRA